MGKHRFQISHILSRPLDILHRPPVFPVEQDGRSGFVAGGINRIGNPLQTLSQRRYLPEDAGIASIAVVNHRSVEFLLPASAFSPLEILHAVGAAGHRLQGGQLVHTRTLLSVHILPVHDGGRAFHQQKRRLFQTSHQRMTGCRAHGRFPVIRFSVPLGIRVPGNDVKLLREFIIIQRAEKFHHVNGYRFIAVLAHRPDLRHAEILHLVAHETLPVQIQAMDADLPVGNRTVNLIPGGIGMAPEGGPPGMV